MIVPCPADQSPASARLIRTNSQERDIAAIRIARRILQRNLSGYREAEPDDLVIFRCRNRRAFHDYAISDTLECGIVLTGTEVKSLRAGQASLEEAYAKIQDGEVWLLGSDIPEYAMGKKRVAKATMSIQAVPYSTRGGLA